MIDCSLAMHWFFEDEQDPEADLIYAALKTGRVRVLVPHIFFPEISNISLIGERRGRCSTTKPEEFVQNLMATAIHVDKEDISTNILKIHGLAKTYALTSYDACYLELALRLHASLSTRDTDLQRAAETAGVTVIQSI